MIALIFPSLSHIIHIFALNS